MTADRHYAGLPGELAELLAQIRPAGAGGARASGARASGARASGARASGARASGARASGARASGARASGARASGARASGARASGARASGARASGARASGARASGAGAGGFGHREHVHLAFLAVRWYGTAEAAERIGRWLRHLTAYAGAPQKYNATVTWAWTEIVGHHLATDQAGPGPAADFDSFAARHPRLLDKRLLIQHYSAAVLASARARTTWVEPDLAPFPWRQQ